MVSRVLHKLVMGIVEFRERMLPGTAELFRQLAAAQTPDALFITCADSRLSPRMLATAEPGDLFTMRNVGNLVPMATADGMSTGDLSEASAIEYAVAALQVTAIVVCGHSECGAMKAALEAPAAGALPNLAKWLAHADAARSRLRRDGGLDATLKPHDQLSQLNVLVQLEHLMSYPVVRTRVDAGALRLIGWWFDIASATMHQYESDRRAFTVIERRTAERLMRQLDAPGR